MKVLMLSMDKKILINGSEARERMKKYAKFFDLHSIVMTDQGAMDSIGQGLFLYPAFGTNFLSQRISLFIRAKKICQRNKFDLVSCQSPDEIGLIGWLISKLFGISLQLQVHTDIFSPWYRKGSWKERLRYYLALFLIPRAYCLRVVSERIKKSIESRFKNRNLKIAILPIFTDVGRFLNASADPEIKERFKEYSFKMISVGRFVDKEKNFSMLFEVMKDFIKICPQALWVLVGDGPDKENYKLQIINYKLENNVVIEPWREDLPSFYKSFDLFLLSSNYEGWGRAVIEAMASGLPIVMTDVGLAGEVVEDDCNGKVVPVKDVSTFLGAIKGLYKDEKKRHSFSIAGLGVVKSMAPKSIEEYVSLYKQILEKCQ